MRVAVIALIVLASVAGCLNKPATTPTDTNSTNSTMPGGGMLPKELLNESHSFAPPAGGPGTKTVKVDAGYTKLNVTVTFRPSTGAPVPAPAPGVSQGVSVKVGTLVCTLSDPIVPTMNPAPCNKTGDATPGDLKIEYTGQGDISARVLVIAS